MVSSPPLPDRALRIVLRTAQHLRCEPEVLVRRLEEGRLWFVFDLVEEARRSLERALPARGDGSPDAVAMEDALRDLDRALRVVKGPDPEE